LDYIAATSISSCSPWHSANFATQITSHDITSGVATGGGDWGGTSVMFFPLSDRDFRIGLVKGKEQNDALFSVLYENNI